MPRDDLTIPSLETVDALIAIETDGFHRLSPSQLPSATLQNVCAFRMKRVSDAIEGVRSLMVPRGALNHVFVELNADPTVNAVAIPRQSFSIITLNLGLVIRIAQLFQFAVNDPSVFPLPGSERPFDGERDELSFDVEPDILRTAVDTTPRKNEHEEVLGSRLVGPIPSSEERYVLAMRLTAAALDFIAMHEYAHIARNHIEIVREVGTAHSFSEVSSRRVLRVQQRQSDRGKNELWQLLELDADRTAAALGATRFTARHAIPTMWGQWASSQADALRLWLIAIEMMWMLFDGWSLKLGQMDYKHPHPAPRLVALLLGVAGTLDSSELGIARSEVLRLIAPVTQDCVRIANHLKLSDEVSSAVVSSNRNEFREAGDVLLAGLEMLTPRIRDVQLLEWRV